MQVLGLLYYVVMLPIANELLNNFGSSSLLC